MEKSRRAPRPAEELLQSENRPPAQGVVDDQSLLVDDLLIGLRLVGNVLQGVHAQPLHNDLLRAEALFLRQGMVLQYDSVLFLLLLIHILPKNVGLLVAPRTDIVPAEDEHFLAVDLAAALAVQDLEE